MQTTAHTGIPLGTLTPPHGALGAKGTDTKVLMLTWLAGHAISKPCLLSASTKL